MNFVKKSWPGLALCLAIAMPAYVLGKHYPIIGGPVIAIIFGMIIALFLKDKSKFESGIRFASKKNPAVCSYPLRFWAELVRGTKDRQAIAADYCGHDCGVTYYCVNRS